MSMVVGVDHDPVIICPYDANHKIARSRIQRHLVKCEKNFPQNFKKQCPYDATHRVFEHELIEHVKNCPMKYICPIEIGQNYVASAQVTLENEKVSSDEEIWDEDLVKDLSASNLGSFKQDSDLVLKRYKSKLRPPFGYSESHMLETTSQSADEDAFSVTSVMGIGRGRGTGQRGRGSSHLFKRGIRGRLLP